MPVNLRADRQRQEQVQGPKEAIGSEPSLYLGESQATAHHDIGRS